jgi:hypothetical protein
MNTVIKKIVIPPSNTKASAFFDELNKIKENIKRKLIEKPFTSPMSGKNGNIGK